MDDEVNQYFSKEEAKPKEKKPFGVHPAIQPKEAGSECAGPKCERWIVYKSDCFMDTAKGGHPETLCIGCGQTLRYRRKKAHQRGESIKGVDIS